MDVKLELLAVKSESQVEEWVAPTVQLLGTLDELPHGGPGNQPDARYLFQVTGGGGGISGILPRP